MTEPITDWFWAFFMLVLLVLIGIAYQIHRIEAKVGEIWKFLVGSDDGS